MSYGTYDSYKDSGVDWLGEIPSDWSLMRFKYIFKEINDRSETGAEELLSVSQYTGVTKRANNVSTEILTNAESLEGYKKVKQNQLVSNIMLAWNGSLAFSKFDGIVSPAYAVYELNNNFDNRFFNYLVRSETYKAEYKRKSTGVVESRLRLYTENFYSIWCAFPEPSEQERISNFLDQKTAQIDQAIALKQQQIEKLNEYKQIVIQNAVTKGLNPNATMKNSGVDWIGDIPEHWEVKKLKHFGVIKSGDSVINSNLTDEGLYEVYGGNGFMGFYNKFNIDKESIIIGRVGALCGNVRYIKEKKWVTDNALIFKLNSKFKDYEYLALVLEAGNLNRLNTSNAQPLITGTKVVNFSIPIPCEKERCEILDVIKSFSTKYSQAITNYQTQIDRLKEYKNILINQAVTGKIKI